MGHKRGYSKKTNFEEHLGTHTLPAFSGVRSKTFNLYKHKGKYIVTNHYGGEFVNQKTYKNLKELKKDYPSGLKCFEKFYFPLLP